MEILISLQTSCEIKNSPVVLFEHTNFPSFTKFVTQNRPQGVDFNPKNIHNTRHFYFIKSSIIFCSTDLLVGA